jgi:8-oxo-dGTP diphosphatase
MPPDPSILARGPWTAADVEARWTDEPYDAGAEKERAADDAIQELRARSSPSHDGVAARLVDFRADNGRLVLDLQPMRWALRLLRDDASNSLSALCLTRDHEGRWLAGRRAAWLSSWAGMWALGAAGAVDVGESPADTLARELREEWSVEADRLSCEALVRVPRGFIMFVGLAWLPEGAAVVPDDEHDAYAWWPADPSQWPDDAHDDLRQMATLLANA